MELDSKLASIILTHLGYLSVSRGRFWPPWARTRVSAACRIGVVDASEGIGAVGVSAHRVAVGDGS